ncbi:MAG: hypothetical protein HLUCCA11_10395 [Phormidesmis priestleyi Ana]|uniref:Uncharacterized protein n=1 Tax=Phormidesmis priestleyi Ana TaxID=1666911 RepID=A0A0N8KN26_9CYAN|nr:MAG: hypothetical protein HLUCCA11_10395 [Phormidesmis priestleyi Ana]
MLSLKTDLLLSEACAHRVSPALLALKRFARGIFKQASIGVVALLVILNLGVHPHEIGPHTSAYTATELTASDLITTPAPRPTPRPTSPTVEAAATARQHTRQHTRQHAGEIPTDHILSASLTDHHLTSARLSIPTAPYPVMVSTAEKNSR